MKNGKMQRVILGILAMMLVVSLVLAVASFVRPPQATASPPEPTVICECIIRGECWECRYTEGTWEWWKADEYVEWCVTDGDGFWRNFCYCKNWRNMQWPCD